MTFKSVLVYVHILAYARMDIRWWSLYTNGMERHQLLDIAHTTVHIYMDTSGSKVLVASFGNQWFLSRFPRHFRLL